MNHYILYNIIIREYLGKLYSLFDMFVYHVPHTVTAGI